MEEYNEHDGTVLEFKWSKMGTVTLYVNGEYAERAPGGGYDKAGTCLGNWIAKTFPKELAKLPAHTHGRKPNGKGFYGLVFYSKKHKTWVRKWREGCSISLDGACGIRAMESILLIATGYDLRYVDGGKSREFRTMFKASPKRRKEARGYACLHA